MPLSYISVKQTDLAKGIDSRSQLNQIQDGYSEDLLNVELNSEGSLLKRKGYQGVGGYIPIRVASMSRTTTALTFTMPTGVDLTGLASTPIVIRGRTTSAQTGDFTDSITEHYYTAFTSTATTLTITDSASGSYSDTAPQIVIYGFQAPAYSSGTAPGYVTNLSVYRREAEEELLAGLGGNLFALKTDGTVPLPSTTVSLTATTTAAATNIAPVFWNSTHSPTRSRGFIKGTNVLGNYAIVTSAAYNTGTTFTDYTLSVTGLTITGTLSTIISSTSGLEDYLTVTNMNHSRLNGEFKIRAATNPAANTLVISVENPDVTEAAYDEMDAGGLVGIFTDRLTTTAASSFVADDRIFASGLSATTDLIYVQSILTTGIVITGVADEKTIPLSSVLTGQRNSATHKVASTVRLLLGDMVNVQGYTRQPRITAVSTGAGTVTFDETLELTHGDTVVGAGRWMSIEIPETDQTLLVPTIVQQFDADGYASQSKLQSALVNDSLFLTNGQDEVFKYDGSTLYKAGLIRWNPSVHFIFSQRAFPVPIQSGPLISWTSISAGNTGDGSLTLVTDQAAAVAPGDRLFGRDDGGRTVVLSSDELTKVTIGGELHGIATASAARKIKTYKYYFRLNALDANNNRMASATTASQDCVLDVVGSADSPIGLEPIGGQVQIRLTGLPEFGPQDWDRLEIQIYKTAPNTPAPFYLLSTRQVPITSTEGYITVVDNTDDPSLVPTPDPVATALSGKELGPSWESAPLAKFAASINNRLVLGNTTDYPEATVVLRPRSDVEENKQPNRTSFQFLRTDAVTPGTTDMVNQVRYENVYGTFAAIDSTADGLVFTPGTDAITFNTGGLNRNIYRTSSVRFTTTGTLPTPLVAGQTYYVHRSTGEFSNTAGSFRITSSLVGNQINILDAGTGVHTVYIDTGEGRSVDFVWTCDRATFTNGSANVVSSEFTGKLDIATQVKLRTTGVLPGGFAVDTVYYVVNTTPIQLSSTVGGTAIVASTAGSGTHTIELQDRFIFRARSHLPMPDITTSWGGGYSLPTGSFTPRWIYLFNHAGSSLLDDFFSTSFQYAYQADLTGWFQVTKAIAAGTVIVNSKSATTLHGVLLTFPTSAVDLGAETISIPNHRLQMGDRVQLFAESGSITGITSGTDYYVYVWDTDTISLFTNEIGGAQINFTATTTGTFALVGFPGSNVYFGTNRVLVAQDARDVPVYAYTANTSDWRFWYSAIPNNNTTEVIHDQRDQYWSLRMSSAINATMRNTSQTTGFTPWLSAQAGSDQGVNTLIIRRPRAEDGLPQIITTGFDPALADLFVNGVKTDTSEQISFEQRVFPSRCLVSYGNYPEIFDDPNNATGLSDSVMDINAADGQEITGLASFMGDSAFGAAQLSDVLVVFKSSSIYVCDLSDSNDGVTPAAVAKKTTRKLDTNGLGCTIPGSIALTHKGIVFANNSGVFVLGRDLTVSYFGRYMEGFWKRVNKDVPLVPVAYHDQHRRQYRISVPIDGSTVNNAVFVYDYTRESDAGGITPAGRATGLSAGAWTRFDNFPATCWATTTDRSYFGTTDGQVFTLRQEDDKTDYRDDADAVSEMVFRYKPTDFGETGSRKVVGWVITDFAAASDMTGTTLETAIDLTENFKQASDFEVELGNPLDMLSDENEKRIQAVRSSPVDRRCRYIQLQYRNSTKDEPVTISGITYIVAGLPVKYGITQDSAENQAK